MRVVVPCNAYKSYAAMERYGKREDGFACGTERPPRRGMEDALGHAPQRIRCVMVHKWRQQEGLSVSKPKI